MDKNYGAELFRMFGLAAWIGTMVRNFCSQRGLQIGPIQRMGAAPGVIHTGRFFVLIPL